MRKLLGAGLAVVLFSCGGGGGGSVSTPLSPTPSTAGQAEQAETAENSQAGAPLTGYFTASKVKGLTVCAPAFGECVQTDAEGKFQFKKTPFKEGEKVEFYAGGLFIGDAEVKENGEIFNPIVVAEGDVEVGSAIGALLHALAGDEGGNAEVIDLSKAEVETGLGESLEKLLKEGKSCLVKTKDGRIIKVAKVKVEVCADEKCTQGKEVKWGKDWLVIYYGAADNDLFPAILSDVNSIKVPENADAVALLDDSDMIADVSTSTYSLYEYDHQEGKMIMVGVGAEEIDTASGETLEEMLSLIMATHPARHYFLIISSHGDGVRALPKRFVAYDENPEDALFNYEFAEALRRLAEKGFPKFDIIGFDECLSGSSELLYAVKDFVKGGVIASEYTEPGYGWDYSFLSALTSTSPEEVGKAAVDAYGKYYSSMGLSWDGFRNLTLAYYPVEFIKTYSEGVKEFSQAALNSDYLMEKLGQIRSSLVPVETYDEYSRADAYDLWQKLYDAVDWKECSDEYCQKAKKALEKILSVKDLPYTYHQRGYSDGVGEGLPSIFFPYKEGYDFYFTEKGEGYYNPFTETYWPKLVQKLLEEGLVEAPQYESNAEE